MEVGAISGAMGGIGPSASTAGSGAATGTGPAGDSNAVGATALSAASGAGSNPLSVTNVQTLLSGQMTQQMQDLINALSDFSSAEILIALMLMRASEKNDRKTRSSGGAAALLAGMALAGRMNQMNIDIHTQSCQIVNQINATFSPGTGLQINFSV